jgi:hypothetical protein
MKAELALGGQAEGVPHSTRSLQKRLTDLEVILCPNRVWVRVRTAAPFR